ncbi:MAG TPA: hypothetical protein VNY52_10250 [Solirubrobacteraceae bacterium]|jgi:hypothetical protein|nr:hypothetical protein [Solirubrobacteraceae bacterium]
MSTTPVGPRTFARRALDATRSRERMTVLRVGLLAFAAYCFATAALMILAPHVFFADVGPFGIQNDHYMRDTATFYAAFAAALLVAYWRPGWRTPVLCCVALQFVLHSINHLVDIGAAHPHWLGPADFISLALATAVLVWLARESLRPLEVQR